MKKQFKIQVMLLIFIGIFFSCSKESALTTPVSEDYSGLYSDIVNSAKDGWHIVEVGSWKGKSSSFIILFFVILIYP
jgi:hypothetical protein